MSPCESLLLRAARAVCGRCAEAGRAEPGKDPRSGRRSHPGLDPGEGFCPASGIWDMVEAERAVEGTGNRREYWMALATAVRAMDRAQACADCRARGLDPMALANTGECEECACRVAEGVESAALDWEGRRDLVRRLAARFASAFRRYRDALGYEPEDAHGDARAVDEASVGPARAAFWEAVRELDSVMPEEDVQECRTSGSGSGSSATSGS